jgi:hypothetical protein
MSGKAYICRLKGIAPIEGADRIVQATMFGETIITSIDNKEGTLGLLFDCDTQLSHEFASNNNLYRHSELNVNKEEKGYLEDNRKIRPIKLKGVKCSAMFIPADSLEFTGIKELYNYLTEGEEIDSYNGIPICNKYINPATTNSMGGQKAVKKNLVPTFKEHIDTDQLAKNLHLIKEGNFITVTEKLHGTSGRCGYLPVEKDDTSLLNKLITKLKIFGDLTKIKKEYQFVIGSRRVVKSVGEEIVTSDGYCDTDIWSLSAREHFEGKLYKGETVYYEIVGYLPEGSPIMNSSSNEKLKPFMNSDEYKTFIKRYGNVTEFNYGLQKGQYDVYVYRITMTNEDGESVDYSWDQVKKRCERLGVKYTPEYVQKIVTSDMRMEDIVYGLSEMRDTPSQVFPEHIKEGICVRIDNGSMTPIILKDKTYNFKIIENLIKSDNIVDTEEAN